MTSVAQRVKKVIASEFGVDPDVIGDDTVAADIDGWDSLRHVMLIANMEVEFSCNLSTMEIASIECVGDIVSIFERKTQ